MAQNPPEGSPRLAPYLYYRDVSAALDWLAKAFGFAPSFQLPGPDGGIVHAEMKLQDALVMMGPVSEERGTGSPQDLGAVSQSIVCYVDDVDAHHAHAKQAGAQCSSEPMDMFWGDRMYTVADCEGHQWSFATHVKDVAPEDMKPPAL